MKKKPSSSSLPFLLLISIIFLLAFVPSPANGRKASRGRGFDGEEGWKSAGTLVEKEHRQEIIRTKHGKISAVDVNVDPRLGGRNNSSSSYHLEFISLEPNSLFLPVLLHVDMVFYVSSGKGRLSYADEEEKDTKHVELQTGDVYRLKSGTVFYLMTNSTTETEPENRRLRVNAIFSNAKDRLQEQWVGAYSSIQNIVLGFDNTRVLQATFQVSEDVVEEITYATRTPLIVRSRSKEDEDEKKSAKEEDEEEESKDNEEEGCITLGHEVGYVKKTLFGVKNKKKKGKDKEKEKEKKEKEKEKEKKEKKQPKTFNFFKEDPDVKNCNGWSTRVNEKNLSALNGSNIGVYMVNLNPGSMLEPHWNPSAPEIGLVLEGRGMVRIVCSSPLTRSGCNNTRFLVEKGDVFMVPRSQPVAQMSFNNESLVFLGFSISTKNNSYPQFLSGKSSILNVLKKDVLQATFNVNSTTVAKLLAAKKDLPLLKCLSCAEEEHIIMEEERRQREEEETEEKEPEREEEETEEEPGKEGPTRWKRKEEKERRRREEEESQREREETEEEAARREEEEREREWEGPSQRRQESQRKWGKQGSASKYIKEKGWGKGYEETDGEAKIREI